MKQGFIGKIVLIVIAIAFLSYWLKIDVIGWLSNPKISEIVRHITDTVTRFWDTYVRDFFEMILKYIRDMMSANS